MYGGGFGGYPPDPLFTGGTLGPGAGMGGGMPLMFAGETVMIMPSIPMGIDIPPGLEYLFSIGSAHVQQKTDIVEMTTRIDTPNKYMIYNDQGHFIYYAQEVQSAGEFAAAQVVGDSRGFRFQVTDAMNRVVFTIFRTSKLWTNCEMIIEAPPGMPCGYASFQSNLLCRGVMTIMDQFRRPILTIPFPSERDAHLSDRGYPLMMGGMLVGAIIRKFPGFAKQVMTNCDNFALTFPVEVDVRVKAVLLACAILIDFIDFEDKRDVTRGKRKTISPQARASLGNPFQSSVNIVPATPYAMAPQYVSAQPVVQVMQPQVQYVQQVQPMMQQGQLYPQQQQYQQQPMQQQQYQQQPQQQYQQQPMQQQQYQQQPQQQYQQQPQQQQQYRQQQPQQQQFQQQPQQQQQQYQQQPQQQQQQYQQHPQQQQPQQQMQQQPQQQQQYQQQMQQQPQQQQQVQQTQQVQQRSVMGAPGQGVTNPQATINQRQQSRVTVAARSATPASSQSLGAPRNTPQKSVYADKKKKK